VEKLPINVSNPTPDPELNVVLHELVASVQAVLRDNFVAAYLQGSFAVGDWDADRDVDFLIAVDYAVRSLTSKAHPLGFLSPLPLVTECAVISDVWRGSWPMLPLLLRNWLKRRW
jgi:hypothetical protein